MITREIFRAITLVLGLNFVLAQDCIENVEVELWGECYNIETTTELNLENLSLEGEIPSEIESVFPYISSGVSWSPI